MRRRPGRQTGREPGLLYLAFVTLARDTCKSGLEGNERISSEMRKRGDAILGRRRRGWGRSFAHGTGRSGGEDQGDWEFKRAEG